MIVSLLSAIAAILSVVFSGSIAFRTLRASELDSRLRNASSYALLMLPRRLDAIETIWARLFEKEAGATLTDKDVDEVIRAALWLPVEIREPVLTAIRSDSQVDQHDFDSLRDELVRYAGVAAADVLQEEALRHHPRGSKKGIR